MTAELQQKSIQQITPEVQKQIEEYRLRLDKPEGEDEAKPFFGDFYAAPESLIASKKLENFVKEFAKEPKEEKTIYKTELPCNMSFHIDRHKSTRNYLFVGMRGTPGWFANALRRTLITDVPTLAIERVDVTENTSLLFDEFLVHRLGLIPIVVSEGSHILSHRLCGCEGDNGCNSCRFPFTIDVVNHNEETILVTQKDVHFHSPMVRCVNPDLIDAPWIFPGAKYPAERKYFKDYSSYLSKDSLELTETLSNKQAEAIEAAPSCFMEPNHCGPTPVVESSLMNDNKDIVLVELRKGQAFRCKGYASWGNGHMHAKWSPACAAVFRYNKEIYISGEALHNIPYQKFYALEAVLPMTIKSALLAPHLKHPRIDFRTRPGSLRYRCVDNENISPLMDLLDSDRYFCKHVEIIENDDIIYFDIESSGTIPAIELFENAILYLRMQFQEVYAGGMQVRKPYPGMLSLFPAADRCGFSTKLAVRPNNLKLGIEDKHIYSNPNNSFIQNGSFMTLNEPGDNSLSGQNSETDEMFNNSNVTQMGEYDEHESISQMQYHNNTYTQNMYPNVNEYSNQLNNPNQQLDQMNQNQGVPTHYNEDVYSQYQNPSTYHNEQSFTNPTTYQSPTIYHNDAYQNNSMKYYNSNDMNGNNLNTVSQFPSYSGISNIEDEQVLVQTTEEVPSINNSEPNFRENVPYIEQSAISDQLETVDQNVVSEVKEYLEIEDLDEIL